MRLPYNIYSLSKPVFFAAITLMLAACATDGGPKDEAFPKSGFINAPGGPVWYEIKGAGDGAPLLTVHGGPGGTSCWFQIMAPLGDERWVIRYDQLGSGRSGRPDDPSLWNRDRFVEELHALRQELGLKELHLLGHSWGGSLAAYYVLQKGGEGIKSLTLSSPLISTKIWIEDANFLRAQMPEEIQEVLDKHEKAGTIDSDEYQAASDEFYDRHVWPGEAIEEYECPAAPWNSVIYNQMWGPTEFRATGSLQDFDLTPRLSEISVPTLFITGELDEARPETIAKFAAQIPGAKLVVIPDAGHRTASRAPALYRQTVRDFINQADQE